MVSNLPAFRRRQADVLAARLREAPRFLEVVVGPRQVGKTTLVRQVLAEIPAAAHLASADDPGLRDRAWLRAQWEVGRQLSTQPGGAVLALDEIQKIDGWPDVVKSLWDADRAGARLMHVILLWSSPVAIQTGLSDSLAGRFEIVRLGHWSFAEMRQAFGWDLDRFILYGGYPGAAPLVDDAERWRAYMVDSLIETAISRDVLLLTRVDKPALLRQLFRLGVDYSGQAVSYTKLLGQLQDAGNTVTLAHYLRLLGQVGLLTGLEKYAGSRLRQRGSSPKLLALDPGIVTAMSFGSRDLAPGTDAWGRQVETAVGAHLVNTASRDVEVTWWREGDREVDYVVSTPRGTLGLEVASGARKDRRSGLSSFERAFPGARTLLVGGQGLPLEPALSTDAADLLT